MITSIKEKLAGLMGSKRKMAGLAVIGMITIVTVVLLSNSVNQAATHPLIIFGENKLLLQVKDKQEPIVIASPFFSREESGGRYPFYMADLFFPEVIDSYAKFSSDNSKLYYFSGATENSCKLNYVDMNSKTSVVNGAKSQLLAVTDYCYFMLSRDGGQIIYSKEDELHNESLYIHNLSKELKIASEIKNVWFSAAKSVIYYSKLDSDDKVMLYSAELDTPDQSVMLDSDIGNVEYFDEESGVILYSKFNEDKAENYKMLYSKTPNSDPIILLQEFDTYIAGSQVHSFYYTVVEKQEESRATDEETTSSAGMSLYFYKDGQSKKMGDHFSSFQFSNVEHQVLIYQKDEAGEGSYSPAYEDEQFEPKRYYLNEDQPATMNFNSSPYNWNTRNKETYIVGDAGVDSLLLVKGVQLVYAAISADGKLLYTHEIIQSKHQLARYELDDGVPANRQVIAEDIYKFTYIPEDSSLFYFKNVANDSTGELHSYLNGESRLISNDVQLLHSTYYPKDGLLLYTKNSNQNNDPFEVYGYQEKDTFQITDHAAAYFYSQDSKLYYLDNFNAELGYGDLKQYIQQGDSILIYKKAIALSPLQHGYLF
ncbi:hypothetical protein [Paenibacillus sp. FSL H8-0537]|uniref:hypothetical protein n=1 Tax=Paenibacillus sp. FSL H8-0537 TaxID=2921399 RepID=UPI003101B108